MFMANVEHTEKYGWWPNKFEPLGVKTLEKNGMNNYKAVPLRRVSASF
jgi:hypothetical protein